MSPVEIRSFRKKPGKPETSVQEVTLCAENALDIKGVQEYGQRIRPGQTVTVSLELTDDQGRRHEFSETLSRDNQGILTRDNKHLIDGNEEALNTEHVVNRGPGKGNQYIRTRVRGY